MSESAPQIFKPVTPEQYARLTEKAKTSGINIAGPRGTAAKFGVEVAWNYSDETQELTIQCLKTPFFVNSADVDSKIAAMVHESLA